MSQVLVFVGKMTSLSSYWPSLVQRSGELRAGIVPTVNAANLRAILRENGTPESRIAPDHLGAYRALDEDFLKHDLIDHGRKEYVRENVHVNTLEGWFSLLTRGLNALIIMSARNT